jgi:hypothetical protein
VSKVKSAAIVAVLAVVIGGGAVSTLGSRPREAGAQGGAPDFLQPGQCYRIAFPIDGPPNYKVLELSSGGWIKAEVDAGSAKAQRQSLWINTAQIVTMREARCSE